MINKVRTLNKNLGVYEVSEISRVVTSEYGRLHCLSCIPNNALNCYHVSAVKETLTSTDEEKEK